MAQLRGYAVAALGPKWWDHTYATSTDGHLWGCFGRDSGGRILDSGQGDSAVADCLARPIKHPLVYAGIKYGITGVCHQAANRILYPGGITVVSAKGYGLSMTTFGTYGRGAWPERDHCVKLILTGAPASQKGDGPDMQSKDLNSTLSRRLYELHRGTHEDSPEIGTKELQFLADSALGVEYDRNKIAAVIRHQQELRWDQDALARQLDNGVLSRSQYLEKLNALLRRIYSECEKILGSKDFERLFGAPRDQVEHMVDPDVFLAER